MKIHKIINSAAFPAWIDRPTLVGFLHENLKPYEDTVEDIERGLDYAFSSQPGKGGFVLLAEEDQRLVGALVMLHTGMKGYIPPNLLLFIAVDKHYRSKGIGRKLCAHAIAESKGDVSLHVEYDNPAKRLYERLGFNTKYAEMRLKR
ncbi:MAG: GNAT family N-acetyltransferase [Kiritimatiellia bacterium]|nr:GNAT family N-acetyltransferase [Kiritimatiellia bacterium]